MSSLSKTFIIYFITMRCWWSTHRKLAPNSYFSQLSTTVSCLFGLKHWLYSFTVYLNCKHSYQGLWASVCVCVLFWGSTSEYNADHFNVVLHSSSSCMISADLQLSNSNLTPTHTHTHLFRSNWNDSFKFHYAAHATIPRTILDPLHSSCLAVPRTWSLQNIFWWKM